MKPEPRTWQADIVELLETLRRFRVPFLIAGGFAVAHAGHLRATKDVDVFVPSTKEASQRLARALSDFLGALPWRKHSGLELRSPDSSRAIRLLVPTSEVVQSRLIIDRAGRQSSRTLDPASLH